MMSCIGCKNRGKKEWSICGHCVGFNNYEPYGPSASYQVSYSKPDISREMKMLAKAGLNSFFGVQKPDMRIKKVIFNDPATVIIWKDGTKTIVRAGEGEGYDPEKGLAMTIAKKALGNQGNYYNVFKTWLPEEDEFKELPESLKQLIDEKTIKSEFIHDDNGIKLTVTNMPPQIQWLSTKEVAEANGLSVECVRKQIKDGLIPLAEKVGGKWKIPCYVFNDHVEIKCM